MSATARRGRAALYGRRHASTLRSSRLSFRLSRDWLRTGTTPEKFCLPPPTSSPRKEPDNAEVQYIPYKRILPEPIEPPAAISAFRASYGRHSRHSPSHTLWTLRKFSPFVRKPSNPASEQFFAPPSPTCIAPHARALASHHIRSSSGTVTCCIVNTLRAFSSSSPVSSFQGRFRP